jgi:transcriptional regulator NrdR family protein
VPKPTCPWCGSQTSHVYRSKGAVRGDAYRRRRRCADCGDTWPTLEGLDRVRFARELAERGVDPAQLGLDDEDQAA